MRRIQRVQKLACLGKVSDKLSRVPMCEYVSLIGARQDGQNGTHLRDMPELMTA